MSCLGCLSRARGQIQNREVEMRDRKFGSTDLEVSEICFGPRRFSAKEPGEDAISQTGQRALEHTMILR